MAAFLYPNSFGDCFVCQFDECNGENVEASCQYFGNQKNEAIPDEATFPPIELFVELYNLTKNMELSMLQWLPSGINFQNLSNSLGWTEINLFSKNSNL